jgi:hypothetical protein
VTLSGRTTATRHFLKTGCLSSLDLAHAGIRKASYLYPANLVPTRFWLPSPLSSLTSSLFQVVPSFGMKLLSKPKPMRFGRQQKTKLSGSKTGRASISRKKGCVCLQTGDGVIGQVPVAAPSVLQSRILHRRALHRSRSDARGGMCVASSPANP